MLGTKIASNLLFLVALAIVAHSQRSAPATESHGATEFPAILEQGIIAGKTAVGTKIAAKLQIATLVNGTVVPRNAVLHGEVIESTPKTAAGPSRLAIRMNSLEWKNGSAPITVYLTVWYYLATAGPDQNLQYGPPLPPSRTWNGQGAYPNPNSGSYKPFPGSDPNAGRNSLPGTDVTVTSDHLVAMKDVESLVSGDGTLALASQRHNIKLDRLTTYVFATRDLQPIK